MFFISGLRIFFTKIEKKRKKKYENYRELNRQTDRQMIVAEEQRRPPVLSRRRCMHTTSSQTIISWSQSPHSAVCIPYHCLPLPSLRSVIQTTSLLSLMYVHMNITWYAWYVNTHFLIVQYSQNIFICCLLNVWFSFLSLLFNAERYSLHLPLSAPVDYTSIIRQHFCSEYLHDCNWCYAVITVERFEATPVYSSY